MKKLMFAFFASFAMLACTGNQSTSECGNDSIPTDSDTIVNSDSAVDSSSVDTLVVNK